MLTLAWEVGSVIFAIGALETVACCGLSLAIADRVRARIFWDHTLVTGATSVCGGLLWIWGLSHAFAWPDLLVAASGAAASTAFAAAALYRHRQTGRV